MRKLKLWGLNQGPPVSRWWSEDSGSEPFGCEVRALGLPPATTVARSRSSQEPSGFGLYPVSRELTPMTLYLCFRNNPVAAGGDGPLWLMNCIRKVEIANNTFHCSWTAPEFLTGRLGESWREGYHLRFENAFWLRLSLFLLFFPLSFTFALLVSHRHTQCSTHLTGKAHTFHRSREEWSSLCFQGVNRLGKEQPLSLNSNSMSELTAQATIET